MKIISLIPARGGSKGIPKKNIVNLAGKPLIAHSIEYSRQCKIVNRTIVSTDDKEIAKVAKSYGAEVPFLRPPEIARDDTQDFPVFYHALNWLIQNDDYHPDLVVHLRPTSPIRPAGLIEKAINQILMYDEADSLRTIVESPIPPYKTWRLDGRYMTPFVKIHGQESYNMPRQELPEVYWHNGVIDVIRSSTILHKKSISGDNIIPLLMDKSFITVDIDTSFDLMLAEVRMAAPIGRETSGTEGAVPS